MLVVETVFMTAVDDPTFIACRHLRPEATGIMDQGPCLATCDLPTGERFTSSLTATLGHARLFRPAGGHARAHCSMHSPQPALLQKVKGCLGAHCSSRNTRLRGKNVAARPPTPFDQPVRPVAICRGALWNDSKYMKALRPSQSPLPVETYCVCHARSSSMPVKLNQAMDRYVQLSPG